GKSGGEFFTPQDVSELIARLTVLGKTRVGRVYETSSTEWIQIGTTYALAA
ncbi:MAG: N-6 DNA methylase, partial [Varibaculum cambriense]|nr:N-6 DNA methylase [Varibaculum cambriense]